MPGQFGVEHVFAQDPAENSCELARMTEQLDETSRANLDPVDSKHRRLPSVARHRAILNRTVCSLDAILPHRRTARPMDCRVHAQGEVRDRTTLRTSARAQRSMRWSSCCATWLLSRRALDRALAHRLRCPGRPVPTPAADLRLPSNEQGCALRPVVKRFLSLEAPHCKHDANVVPAPRDRATARRPSRDRAGDHLRGG